MRHHPRVLSSRVVLGIAFAIQLVGCGSGSRHTAVGGAGGGVGGSVGGSTATGGSTPAGGAGGTPTATPTPVLFLQRAPRNPGSVFDYGSYAPGARILRLNDATVTSGEPSVVCCQDPLFDALDISSFDVAFDASEIVFAGRRGQAPHWALYVASLASGAVVQLSSDNDHDYLDPIFLPGGRILFATNRTPDGSAQYQDEVDRSVVLQFGTMARDGSDERLGPSNLSARRWPTLAADGRVLFAQRDALGPADAGHLMFVSPDSVGGLSAVREAFGKEGSGAAAAYWNASELGPGRMLGIAGPVGGTFGSGALVELRLGRSDASGGYSLEMSEANASERVLSSGVPLDGAPSSAGVGRYADAVALDAGADPELLVSWADGAVTVDALGAAAPNFGLYRFDSATGKRTLVYDDPERWETMPRLLRERTEPPTLEPPAQNPFNPNAVLIGSANVYTSTLFSFDPGSVVAVRVIEGYSSEEGFPGEFGNTSYEGAAILGEAPVYSDGSWLAVVPANAPLRLQAVDAFGMALHAEPVWISGAPGESLFCGGCHESRSQPPLVSPGSTMAAAIGPTSMLASVAKADRLSRTYTGASVVGVPWDLAIQPIFDAKCVSCHDGTRDSANASWTVTDPATGSSFFWTFNLEGSPMSFFFGNTEYGGFTSSYFSLAPPTARLEADGLQISGDFRGSYVDPGSARTSRLIQKLNPPSRVTPTQRAFDPTTFPPHAAEVGQELDADQYRLLVLWADVGGQFYSRENKP